jgi:hypothetical protein
LVELAKGPRYNRRGQGRQNPKNRDNNIGTTDMQNKSGNSSSYRERNKNTSVQFRPKQPKQEGVLSNDSTTTTTASVNTSTTTSAPQEQQQQHNRGPAYQKRYNQNRQYNSGGRQQRGNTSNISTATTEESNAPRNFNNSRTQGGGYKSKSYTGRRNTGNENSSSEAISNTTTTNAPLANLVPFNTVDNLPEESTATLPFSASPYIATAPFPYPG